MRKLKTVSMLIAVVMLFSTAPAVPASADDDAPRMEIYSQDFEEDVKPLKLGSINIANATDAVTETKDADSFTQPEDESGRYGSFADTVMNRNGFEFSESSITSGKLYVSFDFRPTTGIETGQSGVVIGNSLTNTSITDLDKKQSLDLIWLINGKISVGGRGHASGKGQKLQVGGEDMVPESKWYSYSAALDLDAHTMSVELREKGSSEVLSSYDGTIARRTGKSEWELWPIEGTPFRNIAAVYGMDLDNIKVAVDPVLDSLSFYNAAGTETSNAYDNTKGVGVRFAAPIGDIAEGGILFNGEPAAGELSLDGKTYSFPAELSAGEEYTVEVDAQKLTAVGGAQGYGSKTITFTASEFSYIEDFEGDAVTAYDFSHGAWKALDGDTAKFEVKEENGNRIGAFHQDNTLGHRIGLDIGDMMADGAVNIHFDFRTTEGITSFVTVGNEYEDKSQHNWLGLLASPKENASGVRYIYAGTGHGSTLLQSDHVLKTADGEKATIKPGAWYTYDAVVDVNNRSMQVKVTDAEGNAIGGINLLDMPVHDGTDNDQRFHDWPAITDMKALAVLQRTDLDNISISKAAGVIGIDSLSFTDGNGDATEVADASTAYINIKLTNPASSVYAELDGNGISGEMSEDGLCYSLPVSGLIGGREYIVTISDIVSVGSGYIEGKTSATFTVDDGFDGFKEDFDGYTHTVYDFSGGAWKQLGEDTAKFEVTEDKENKIGAFHQDNTLGHRIGFNIGDAMAAGKVKVHFDFRVKEDIGSFVTVGNEYADKSQHNWLGLLASPKENASGVRYIYAGTGHGSVLLKSDHVLKTETGANARIDAGKWYTYDAVIDIDNHNMQVIVTDADKNEVGRLTLIDMPVHDSSDNDQRFNDWPAVTDLKAFAVMHRTDLDNIMITATDESIEGADRVRLVESFDGNTAKVYNYTGGAHSTPVADYLYETRTEEENNYGRFHVSVPESDPVNADYRRIGLDISGSPRTGAINVSFRFRPQTLGTRSTVLLGNEDDKTLHNWFSALNVTSNGNLLIGRGYGSENDETAAAYMVKDADGNVLGVNEGEWYGYSAVIDLDSHSIYARITDSAGNILGGIELEGMEALASNYNMWPKETNFRALATLFATELDDISITNNDRILLSTENGKAYASVVVRDTDPAAGTMIIAQYDADGRLLSVDTESIEMKKNKPAQEFTVSADVNEKTAKLKAMLWDSFMSMTPLKGSVVIR